MPNKIINQINLKNSDGQSSELYDIGANAVNVMYDNDTNIKTKIDSKADTQAVGQSIQQIRNVIPSTATSSNQLITANDLDTAIYDVLNTPV